VPQGPSSGAQAPRRLTWKVVAGALAAGVGAAVIGGVVGSLASDNSPSTDVSTSAASGSCPAVAVADAVLPTVVTLSVVGAGGSSGTGSGEVIRSEGYILTNDHVISAAAGGGTVSVRFNDGQTESAKIVGRAPQVDLAVVKVDAAQKLPTITYGVSETLHVGEPVVALGSPLGLDGSVTSGIVSALGRDVPVPAAEGQTALLPGAIQTDAAINPGNSGGALVDCAGHLVGVNTAISTVPNEAGQAGGGSVGIGFAVPVDLARQVADQLISTGQFVLPTLGVSTAPLPPAAAEHFGVSGGLYVLDVSDGGPAAQAGLQPSDVITHVDGQATTGPDSLFLITVTKHAGDKVDVEYVREGKTVTTAVTLTQQK
jgi:putative serine protease PepD